MERRKNQDVQQTRDAGKWKMIFSENQPPPTTLRYHLQLSPFLHHAPSGRQRKKQPPRLAGQRRRTVLHAASAKKSLNTSNVRTRRKIDEKRAAQNPAVGRNSPPLGAQDHLRRSLSCLDFAHASSIEKFTRTPAKVKREAISPTAMQEGQNSGKIFSHSLEHSSQLLMLSPPKLQILLSL